MSKIQSFGTKGKLRDNEILAFGREIEAEVKNGSPSTLLVASSFLDFQNALQTYDDSIVGVSKSVLTSEMDVADGERDNFYAGINEQIYTGTRHFEAEKRAAAIRLSSVRDTFIGGQNRGYVDQTGFTYNFIQELTSDAHKADVETLGLTGWVTHLKSANDHCALLESRRNAERAERPAKGATVVARRTFEHAYDALVERFNALALINGDELYTQLFGWWNACIDRYRVLISNRLGAGKGGITGGGSSTPSTPSTPPSEDRPEIE